MLLQGCLAPYWVKSFLGSAVSRSPAAPLCWVFCLPPREPVGPAGLCAQGLGGNCSELVLQTWLPRGSQAVDQGTPGVSVVGAQSADLGWANVASGVCWGCLSSVHSPGAEGVGTQEAMVAAESSLNSR